MAEERSWSPDVGYWAERWDPDGRFHPLLYTERIGDDWIQVTSLAYAYVGVPLWWVAGAHGLLVVPALGSLLAAFGARHLARAVGAPTGWPAFWLVGAASPMLFYAGDFWEHSMAVGLALWGIALAFDRPTLARAAAAGALLGLAGVLRTEMLVYTAVLAVALLVARERRREWFARPVAVVVAVVAGAIPVLVNHAVESAVFGSSVRVSRVSSQADAATATSEVADRVHDALVTTFALFPDDAVRSIVLGAALAAVLAVVGRALRRTRFETPVERAAAAVGTLLVIGRAADGLGFVPGLFAASPAGAGLGGADTSAPRHRAVVGVALGALPVVWAFQWRGQLIPQWGGRLTLLSGALLTVIAAVMIERAPRTAPAAVVVGVAVLVTAFGAAWHVDRTGNVASAAAELLDVPSDVVVVSGIAHLGREAGAFYGERRWLSSVGGGDLRDAVAVARRAGVQRLDVVELETNEVDDAFAGFVERGTREVEFLGFTVVARRFERVPR